MPSLKWFWHLILGFSSHIKVYHLNKRALSYELLSLMPFKSLDKKIRNAKFMTQVIAHSSDVALATNS